MRKKGIVNLSGTPIAWQSCAWTHRPPIEMIGVIARFVDALILSVCKEVLLYVFATALELLTQKVILPPSPLG